MRNEIHQRTQFRPRFEPRSRLCSHLFFPHVTPWILGRKCVGTVKTLSNSDYLQCEDNSFVHSVRINTNYGK